MKKTTKGALAAAAAGILLLGSAGTIAFWSDSEPIAGGAVTTGTLALGTSSCDDDWVYAVGNAKPGTLVSLIVPGDTISKECTFTISATGDNLEATLTTPATTTITTEPVASTFDASVAVAYAIGPVPIDPVITSANDGNTVTATITVAFPFDDSGVANLDDTQKVTATLDGIEVTLVQTES